MRRALAQAFSEPVLFAATLLALWLFGLPSPVVAQDWSAPARELSDKLRAQVPPPARLSWSVQNLSTLPDDVVAAIRRAITSELRSAGYRPSASRSSVAQVRISLSENFESYIWVAQVQHREARDVVIINVPHPPAAPPPTHSSLELRRKLLVAREEPILDLALLTNPAQATPQLLVLGRSTLSLYEMSGSSWQQVQTAPITAPSMWPRDLRGRVIAHADGTFEATLPGQRCLGSAAVLANLDCHLSDEPWPFAASRQGYATATLVAGRNYFTGPLLLPDHTPLAVPDFYSAADLPGEKNSLWLVASTGGLVEMRSARGGLATFPGWGSQLAVVSSTCGSDTLILATRPTDFTQPDAVQAFELRGRSTQPASGPLEFPGPLTLLEGSSEEGAALAVARDLSTGFYEAFRLSITCGD